MKSAETAVRPEQRGNELIVYDNVSISYDGFEVLRGFSLRISKGEKVLIYGKSGAGKSSLLKMLLGFVPPREGAVYFEGREVNQKSVWEVRKLIAYVSQDLDIFQGRVSGFLQVVFSLKANLACDMNQERLYEAMAWLELDQKLLDKEMAELSGGERQRLAIVVATLLGREVFLLDEATSAVDPETKAKIVQHFASLEGATVLAASHDAAWMQCSGTRVVRLG